MKQDGGISAIGTPARLVAVWDARRNATTTASDRRFAYNTHQWREGCMTQRERFR